MLHQNSCKYVPLHEKMGVGKSKNGSTNNVEIEDIREKYARNLS
jgi:hypothetical protein